MTISRRDATKLLVLGATALAAGAAPAFAAASPVRLPLHEFAADDRLLKALRKGVAAMKKRKPSDPLSWFYQAAIHGVTDYLWSEQVHDDPGVHNVDRARYWNQCPHKGENSANFLPWHRGYTYHFEQILRMHTEETDFALPYWDYTLPDQRDFPRAFGIEHLDGNPGNQDPANTNPLFHAERDYFLCGYEHPFTNQLPLTSLSSRAVDTSRAMNCPYFFGDKESDGIGGGIADNDSTTRGILEQAPHDQIHRSVGGNVQGTDGDGHPTFSIGGMAVPPTAGFDPIFPVHHTNIDRLWARWADMPGKSWGKLPPPEWLDERPWFFFDTTGAEVNRPRRDYFDRQALGVRFKDDDPAASPLKLPAPIKPLSMKSGGAKLVSKPASAAINTLRTTIELTAPVDRPTAITLSPPGQDFSTAVKSFDDNLKAFAPASERITLTLHQTTIGSTGAFGFDAFLAPKGATPAGLDRNDPQYLGEVSLFNHRADGQGAIDQTFDITRALVALNRRSLSGLDLVLVPFALATAPKAKAPTSPVVRPLRSSGFSVSRQPNDAAPPTDGHAHH